MIKCTDKGIWTCISRGGSPKKSYDTDNEAIRVAKFINEKNPDTNTKLVAYKCSNCRKYHLLSVKKSKK
jgi:hypothetical protein